MRGWSGVLKALRLWEWAQSLPDGLDTPLAGGQSLSAGEAQLLAFARVFLKDPGLVILDEASSRLDPATETLMERAVDRLFAGPYRRGDRPPPEDRTARRRYPHPGRWLCGGIRPARHAGK